MAEQSQSLQYNFDEVISRRAYDSVKWDHLEYLKPELRGYMDSHKDGIPLWIADMDFAVSPQIQKAIALRAQHPFFGYTWFQDDYYECVIQWFQKRHAWKVEKEWISYCAGIVPAINTLIKALTRPGDKIIIQSPVYYVFTLSIVNTGRTVLDSPLVSDEQGRYTIDFEDLEKKASDPKTTLILLSNPHNPVGRVWTEEELKKMADICIRNGVVIVDDCIHCDLVISKTAKWRPLAALSNEIAEQCFTLTSPTKTFNLSGLHISSVICSNKVLQNKFTNEWMSTGFFAPNAFVVPALKAAYNESGEWLDQLILYLRQNFEVLKVFFAKNLPQVQVTEAESTYLIWMNFRSCCPDGDYDKLEAALLDEGVVLESGKIFGEPNCLRINIATPRAVLERALARILKVVKSL